MNELNVNKLLELVGSSLSQVYHFAFKELLNADISIEFKISEIKIYRFKFQLRYKISFSENLKMNNHPFDKNPQEQGIPLSEYQSFDPLLDKSRQYQTIQVSQEPGVMQHPKIINKQVNGKYISLSNLRDEQLFNDILDYKNTHDYNDALDLFSKYSKGDVLVRLIYETDDSANVCFKIDEIKDTSKTVSMRLQFVLQLLKHGIVILWEQCPAIKKKNENGWFVYL